MGFNLAPFIFFPFSLIPINATEWSTHWKRRAIEFNLKNRGLEQNSNLSNGYTFKRQKSRSIFWLVYLKLICYIENGWSIWSLVRCNAMQCFCTLHTAHFVKCIHAHLSCMHTIWILHTEQTSYSRNNMMSMVAVCYTKHRNSKANNL